MEEKQNQNHPKLEDMRINAEARKLKRFSYALERG